MSAIEQLKQIYTKFYDQREVLTEAPALSQDPTNSSFDEEKADKELANLISYLMGVADIQKESFERIVEIIQEHYDDQPEWKELLVEYFQYTTQKEEENLKKQEDDLIKEIEEFTQTLLDENKTSESDTSQQGRTMLETLVVLSIIALLGVLAILWYQKAIDRNEADRDYEDIEMTITSENNKGTTRTQKGIADTHLIYNKTRSQKPLSILYNCPNDTEATTIKVDGMKKEICRLLMEKKWDGPYKPLFFLRGADEQDICHWDGTDEAELYKIKNVSDCDTVEKGSFAVVFNNVRDNVALCSSDDDCGECEHCNVMGVCKGCATGESCVEVFGNPDVKACFSNANLVDGQGCLFPDGEGGCHECVQNSNCTDPDEPWCHEWTCQACLDKNASSCDANGKTLTCKEGYWWTGGYCAKVQQCTTATVSQDCGWKTAGNTCVNGVCACSNGQVLTPTGCYAKNNVLEDAYCKGGIIEGENGEKLCCWKSGGQNCCPYGQVWIGGVCKSCDDSAVLQQTDTNYCLACPNRVRSFWKCYTECVEKDQEIVSGQCRCPLERPIMLQDGTCHSCLDGWQTLNGSNMPVGYTREQIARLCNYQGGTGGYSYPCQSGTVGLWAGETYTQNGETVKAGGGGACVRCYSVTVAQMNSRARCEACNGTWESSAPGTQDEWMHGSCTLKCEQDHNNCVVWDEETQSCQNKCKRVEWIEATGTQYINLGTWYTSTRSIKGKYTRTEPVDGGVSLVATTSSNPHFYLPVLHGTQKKEKFEWGRGGYQNKAYYVSFSGYPYTAEVELDAENDVLKVNGVQIASGMIADMGGYDSPYTSNSTMYMFSRGNSYYGKGRVYYLQIREGGTLIRDFVPVISPEGKGCMFDNVSKVLFCGKGSGELLYGPEVN